MPHAAAKVGVLIVLALAATYWFVRSWRATESVTVQMRAKHPSHLSLLSSLFSACCSLVFPFFQRLIRNEQASLGLLDADVSASDKQS